MHKYFFRLNNLTENKELCKTNNVFCSTLSSLNELDKIKNTIQELYNNIIIAKEQPLNDLQSDQLCKIELLISNLYYSFFQSPLNLPEKNSTTTSLKEILIKAIELSKNLIENINIPEQNRVAYIINLNLQTMLNQLQKEN